MSTPDPMIESADEGGKAPEPSRPAESLLRPIVRGNPRTPTEGTFDFHDTIPAPPWFDETFDVSEAPQVPPR